MPQNAKYLKIYHHWDGYTSGLGATLNEHYKDYDTILNLLTMGDMSSINDTITSYQGWRNEKTPPHFLGDYATISKWNAKKEKWEKRREKMTDKNGILKADKAICEEYAYLFDGENWLVAFYGWDEKTEKSYCTGWLDLADVLEKGEDAF